MKHQNSNNKIWSEYLNDKNCIPNQYEEIIELWSPCIMQEILYYCHITHKKCTYTYIHYVNISHNTFVLSNTFTEEKNWAPAVAFTIITGV